MKKIIIFTICILIIIIIYIYLLILPKNYKVDYIINKVKITEKYNKENAEYFFELNYEKQDYPIIIKKQYEHSRKLINDVKIIKDKEDTCLKVKISNDIKIICRDSEGLKDYRLINDKLYIENFKNKTSEKELEKYNNISVYSKEYKYLIWNYNGYILIDDKNKKINIFKTEKYNNMNTYQSDDFLIIPDYDTQYYYKKIYLYNKTTNGIKDIETIYEISYNSIYLGSYKNKAYILDIKNQNEFEIDLIKFKIRLINEDSSEGLYYDGKEMIKYPIDKMVKKKEIFKTNNVNNYELINNNLYQIILNEKVKISNKKITNIIDIKDDSIFYLVDDTVYMYSYLKGEVKILKYKEWKFNYKNQIFIFNK